MFGGSDETQLLFMGEGILENRFNLLKIIERLGFPLQMPGLEVRVCADLKLSTILTGIHSCTARHNCIYCGGYKPSPSDRWLPGVTRTYSRCKENFDRWMAETNGNEGELKKYFSNKYTPINNHLIS